MSEFLELTSPKYVLFIIRDWNAKVGSQETPRVTGKFGLEIRNEAGQSLTEFCQENALVIANTLFQHYKGPRRRREGKRTENLFDEIIAINFPNLGWKEIFRSTDLRVSQQNEPKEAHSKIYHN